MTLQILLSALLVVLIVSIVFRTFTNIKKKPSVLDIGLLVCTFVVILLIITTRSKSCKKPEHFINEDAEPSANALDKILGIIGIQASSGTDTSQLANQLANAKSINTYNETLQSIQNGMTVYYSAFSKDSYPTNSNTWYNMSTFFSTPDKSCPDVHYDDTHMMFERTPNYSKENGFQLGTNRITGPKSYQLGINGNGSYTIFMTININSFITSEQENKFEIFKVFGNTITNTGVELYFTNVQNTSGNLYSATVNVGIGSQSVSSVLDQSSNTLLDGERTYMMVLVKDNNIINLYMYPGIDNVTTNFQNKIRVVSNWEVDPNEDILFSNKKLSINGHGNIHAKVYNFGIYNKALSETAIGMIFLHTQAELQKTNQLLRDLASTIHSLEQKVEDVKKCPYDKYVCNTCSDIKDWTNMSNIILNGSPECLSSIDKFCLTNPRNDLCACWNPNNTMSQTTQCKNYIGIFRRNNMVSLDAIDNTSLDTIKSKYDLCSCKGMDEIKNLISKNNKKECSSDTVLPRPKLLDTNYRVDKDDLAAYNSLAITNTYEVKKDTGVVDSKVQLSDPFLQNNNNASAVIDDSESSGFWNWLTGKFS